MTDKQRNVPYRRFKEFENADAWEQRKLREFTSYESSSYSSSQFNYTDLKGDFPVFDANKEIARISEYAQKSKYISIIKDGAGIGRTELRPAKSSIIGTMGYILPKASDVNFVYSLMQNINWGKFQNGSTIPHVYYKDYGEEKFYVPKLKEQKEIGKLFYDLDKLITLHQRKYDKLKSLKSAYLTEMFPAEGERKPKRRFSEFTDDWEQRKLGEELDLLKDGTHGTHKNVDQGPYLLSAKNIKNGQIVIDKLTDRKISKDDFNLIHKNFSLQKGDVLLTIVGSIGESAVIDNPVGITFQRSVAYLRPSKKLLSRFLLTNINNAKFQEELKKRQVVSAQPGIYLGDLSVIPILFPSMEEQRKLSEFFQSLDHLITLHQQQLEKLKNLKQAYLNEMFV